jgi:pyrroloquinoline quinone biosynthesis protein D
VFDESTIFRLADVASFQKLGDGAVVLMADSGQLYSANETTESFLSRVDGALSLGGIVEGMLDEYDVERELLTADMLALARDLVAEGILVAAPPADG